jgi:hypothetical protein
MEAPGLTGLYRAFVSLEESKHARPWFCGVSAHHDLQVEDVRIRNVTTDIRGGSMGRCRASFEVEVSRAPTAVISAASLPDKPKLLVLPGY